VKRHIIILYLSSRTFRSLSLDTKCFWMYPHFIFFNFKFYWLSTINIILTSITNVSLKTSSTAVKLFTMYYLVHVYYRPNITITFKTFLGQFLSRDKNWLNYSIRVCMKYIILCVTEFQICWNDRTLKLLIALRQI
jgi:hypothetical protein